MTYMHFRIIINEFTDADCVFVIFWWYSSSIGNGVFNPTPTPPGSGPSPGDPTFDFCGESFDDVVTSCDRLCETNLDCLAGEVCFGSVSSTDCNGTYYSIIFCFLS